MKKFSLEITSAGRIGEIQGKPSRISGYFLLVVFNKRTNRYTVWALPDQERAMEQILRFARVIDPWKIEEALQVMYTSKLVVSSPQLQTLKFRGLAAELFEMLISQNAELSDFIQRNTLADEETKPVTVAN
jgi:hypothetical protein